jgi:hypothetical protein
VYSVSTVFRLIQYEYREKVSNSIFIFRAISLTSVGKPPCFFYTFYLVYIWHYRIKLFLRHLPNCSCSNFSRYVDLFQEISPRIAKQLRFQVKLHHLRQKCKNDNPGFFTNGIPVMKNPDALRIFFPKNLNRWKNFNEKEISSLPLLQIIKIIPKQIHIQLKKLK